MQGFIGAIIALFLIGLVAFLFLTAQSPVNLDTNFRRFFSVAVQDTVSPKTYIPPQTGTSASYYPSDDAKIPAGFRKENLSPYFKKVRIVSVERGTALQKKPAITLSANGITEGVNVTNWVILSNRRITGVIPQGVRDYNPRIGALRENIVLEPRGTAYLYTPAIGSSPIGYSFRENECVGYLNNRYQFASQLPRECPRIQRDDIVSFSGKCQSLLLSLPICGELSGEKRSTIPPDDSACFRFVDSLTYDGCYTKHRNDGDFFSNQWHVWLTGAVQLDPLHDRILLFDRSGLLVDEYIY